ncbi:MAG TPA: NADH-quinone oxidoreductase subunit L [Nevskiaceae bacterium]|nr:NADH-quinone oxidoreductase subunit L [Nevskiaceae bacterium]
MSLLFLVFVFPLLGFVTLAFARSRMPENAAALVGVGSIGLSFLTTIIAGWQFLHQPEPAAYTQLLWTWMSVPGFAPQFALRLDALSLTMMFVITGVGFFIHLFASWYMRGDASYDRFFSYMNLFVASMLFLVLGDNLLFLYFGWEGVGLSSYLLIGFWYQDPANGAAARKAFVVTRVGDTFMAVGLFLIFHQLGTLNIDEAMARAAQHWGVGSDVATLAALLLLGGAVGKSAQLPLQTWLPDAMAGPTPVSALIHAATMVTAGVYLIARTHVIFELSPFALECVGWVGALTALLASFTALTQTDIKRVLAYSTMSQIGYMFLGLGVGAYQPAIFHLMTHAFFKALLFLSAGSVILAMHHEQDIFKMGGLRKQLPFTYTVFLIGCLGLIACPPFSGFFSKDEILFEAYASGHLELWALGLFGAYLTAVYTFRLVFIAFFGESHAHGDHAPHQPHGFDHSLPLGVLAFFAVAGGFIPLHLESVLPPLPISEAAEHAKEKLAALSVIVSGLGVLTAYVLFIKDPRRLKAITHNEIVEPFTHWARAAFGFDRLYDIVFKAPFLWFVRVNRNDAIDVAIGQIPVFLTWLHGRFARTESGKLRWYAAAMGAGAAAVLAVVLWT